MDALRMLPISIAPTQGRVPFVASMTLHGAVALVLLIPWARPPEDVAPPVVVEVMTLAEEPALAPAAAPASAPVATPMPQPPAKASPRSTPPRAQPVLTPSKPAPAPSPMAPAPSPVSDAPAAAETTAAAPTMASAADTPAPGAEAGTGTATGGGTTGHGQGEGNAAPGYTLGAAQTPAPDYPWSARRRGVEGRVVVRLEVGADGCPTQVELIHSSGDSSLDQATIATLWHWRLRPAMAGGVPVAGRVTVPIVFKLT